MNKKNSIIGVIYKPPESNIDNFALILNDLLYKINCENKYCNLMGDFNIDLLKFHNQNQINNYLNLILSNSFFPTISKPTRITQNSATLLDHFYTHHINFEIVSGIIITDISDHLAIFQIINYDLHNNANTTDYSYFVKDINSFSFDLSQADWSNGLQ